MWRKRKEFKDNLEMASTSSNSTTSITSRVSTRSSTRAAAAEENSSSSTPNNEAMSILLRLISQANYPTNPLNTILEEQGVATPSPSCRLPPLQVFTQQSQPIPSPLPSPTSNASQAPSPEPSLTNTFCQAFGTPVGNPRSDLPRLVQARHIIFQPVLDKVIESVQSSTISKHLWSHCQDIQFDEKKDVATWCRTNVKLEILFTGTPLSFMKSAATRKCKLCMRERTILFKHFGLKKSIKGNLMNSRKELHGSCSRKTRCLRLKVLEREGGADEATS